ncbi:MAG: hypothetical protein DRN35_05325 [Thermoplasmata archaeon]|nr:MAG: hypothetical protein DRN28_00335 [Thermoplasmata archaeon]RLF68679.1 MAG: hypothetical protein DRN40_07315 [Thermoplasmata archaeon]RLF69838.1 MAG: hypothetical protein DRN35_05325 [Thermoplasmata archaeon]RLF70263.1 MAG: hypothetical protein DRN55_08755 [Thermoplasmata archaeon]HDD60122.1 phosphotransacetylase family protein [Euryarchaeota archaeon]
MKPIIFGSTEENAGKTMCIIGIGRYLRGEFWYLKPLGDRHVYKKKRLWDHDVKLVTNTFGIDVDPEHLTIGFDHSKLRYMYDENTRSEKLKEMCREAPREMPVVVEGGRNLSFGASIKLDPIQMARTLGGGLVLVVSGEENSILDNLQFLKYFVDMTETDFRGIIINKVKNVEDFNSEHLPYIEEMGYRILGVVPHIKELSSFTMKYIADKLFAKVIVGEKNLNVSIENIFVGTMSVDSAIRSPIFHKEKKLIITSGDRSDIILASLENNTAGIILTNNIPPPSTITSKAEELNIPLLLVPFDTYETARRLNDMVPLITEDDTKKIRIAEETVKKYVDVKSILQSAE